MISMSKIKEYTFGAHVMVNHMYDDMSYSYHLKQVALVALQFIELIPEEFRNEVIAAAYGHDLIEDTRETYNDVVKAMQSRLAGDIIYAVSNDKGKTRAERAGPRYYKGIREQVFASFIKMCDRIANATYSKTSGSSMHSKYLAENKHFIASVMTDEQRIEYKDMIKHLEGIFNEN